MDTATPSAPASAGDAGEVSRNGTPQALAADLRERLLYDLGRPPEIASRRELFQGLAAALRDRLMDRWLETERTYEEENVRRVCYLSMEFLMGRLLRSAVQALGLEETTGAALQGFGARLDELEDEEDAAALGSGGLGRLAACFLDSMATLELPAYGYGLRYRYGLFRQRIVDGWQVEEPDDWLRWGYPWEVRRPEEAVTVSFFGHVVMNQDPDGHLHCRWEGTEDVLAIPFDVPVPGYRTSTVNTLRLWSARPLDSGLRLDVFHSGDFSGASHARVKADTITAVLYPAEHTEAGQELRLKQQFFLASATLQDLVRRHLRSNPSLQNLPAKLMVQLNDTHPAIAIPELMRLLMDVHGYGWEGAWEITRRVFAYTNHTLLPEALETWPFRLVAKLLPRHIQIIQEIDRRFLADVRRHFPGDEERVARMALIGQDANRPVRMAHLSVVASGSVNGVAALHTDLLRQGVLRDFHDMFPERFNNKTNGITPRRWLKQANPDLSGLLERHLGAGWIKDLDRLRELEHLADDPAFRAEFRAIKRANKERLADVIRRRNGFTIDPDAMVDAQIKRFHEYKRQLLMTLYIVDQYLQALRDPESVIAPRTFVFAGKAAADYRMAKLVIKLINAVADTVNNDPRVKGRLKVGFLANYSVSLAQKIVVAADLSEQISTAGYEASGTGNMKFALNGALTIGTLDGANVEIRREVGPENFFLFGLEADQVRAKKEGGYRPRAPYEQSERLREVIDSIGGHVFTQEPGLFHPIVDALLDHDVYMVLEDFAAYCAAQDEASRLYLDPEEWSRRAILNTLRVGTFSSDRTIRQYADEIWQLEPAKVPAPR